MFEFRLLLKWLSDKAFFHPQNFICFISHPNGLFSVCVNKLLYCWFLSYMMSHQGGLLEHWLIREKMNKKKYFPYVFSLVQYIHKTGINLPFRRWSPTFFATRTSFLQDDFPRTGHGTLITKHNKYSKAESMGVCFPWNEKVTSRSDEGQWHPKCIPYFQSAP